MLNKIKIAARTALATIKASIWSLLLIAYPYAEDILALVDKYMPALANLLPPNLYKFVGVVIVAAKFSLQVIALMGRIKAARAVKVA